MGEWFNRRSTSGQDPRTWEALCPQGYYCRCLVNELPPFFASGLLGKIPCVDLINSGPLFAVILNRLDGTEIDQQPFAFVFASGSLPQSGGFIQHGNWSGRTMPAAPDFLSGIPKSGIANSQPVSGLTVTLAGPVAALDPVRQAAFAKLASYMSGSLPP